MKQAQKYLEKYHADYDPIFDASITDTRNDKPFKMSSYDEKTGIVILENNKELTGYPKVVENGKERSINVEVPVKVVKQNGKWLVDGAGNVNLKQNK